MVCSLLPPQVKRATHFLYDLFHYADEKVIVTVTHSGFARSVLLAMGREPYRPQNTELIPIVVSYKGGFLEAEEEDADVEAVDE